MRILGIDPGYAIVGYGIIDHIANQFHVIDYGEIVTTPDMKLPRRLHRISAELSSIIGQHQPDVMAVEELFFSSNQKTAITVGHGRGVILLEGARAGMEVFEYTPIQVKQAVVGYGRAEKHQVQHMIKAILSLKEIPKPDDVADALAIAVCHANSSGHAYGQTKTKMQEILDDIQNGSQQKDVTWEQLVNKRRRG